MRRMLAVSAAILAAALWVFPLWAHLVATLVIIGLSLWAPAPFLADDHDHACPEGGHRRIGGDEPPQ